MIEKLGDLGKALVGYPAYAETGKTEGGPSPSDDTGAHDAFIAPPSSAPLVGLGKHVTSADNDDPRGLFPIGNGKFTELGKNAVNIFVNKILNDPSRPKSDKISLMLKLAAIYNELRSKEPTESIDKQRDVIRDIFINAKQGSNKDIFLAGMSAISSLDGGDELFLDYLRTFLDYAKGDKNQTIAADEEIQRAFVDAAKAYILRKDIPTEFKQKLIKEICVAIMASSGKYDGRVERLWDALMAIAEIEEFRELVQDSFWGSFADSASFAEQSHTVAHIIRAIGSKVTKTHRDVLLKLMGGENARRTILSSLGDLIGSKNTNVTTVAELYLRLVQFPDSRDKAINQIVGNQDLQVQLVSFLASENENLRNMARRFLLDTERYEYEDIYKTPLLTLGIPLLRNGELYMAYNKAKGLYESSNETLQNFNTDVTAEEIGDAIENIPAGVPDKNREKIKEEIAARKATKKAIISAVASLNKEALENIDQTIEALYQHAKEDENLVSVSLAFVPSRKFSGTEFKHSGLEGAGGNLGMDYLYWQEDKTRFLIGGNLEIAPGFHAVLGGHIGWSHQLTNRTSFSHKYGLSGFYAQGTEGDNTNISFGNIQVVPNTDREYTADIQKKDVALYGGIGMISLDFSYAFARPYRETGGTFEPEIFVKTDAGIYLGWFQDLKGSHSYNPTGQVRILDRGDRFTFSTDGEDTPTARANLQIGYTLASQLGFRLRW